jgi:anti-sigma-K factor RskA
VISHEEASELLGAYALHAVDSDEVTEVEEHLDTCPRCRAELDGLREVAGALGTSVEEPPEGLWSGIVSRLPARQEGEEQVPPMPRLEGQEQSPFRAPAPTSPSVPASRRKPRRGAVATVGAFAVAAAAVAVVLGIGLVQADHKVSNLQQAAGHQVSGAAAAALQSPGHQVIHLESTTHRQLAEFVLVPDGRGFLVSSRLPALQSGSTYQLWGLVGNQPISLGLLGPAPRNSTFTMAGSVQPMQLSITAEPAGGSVTPTGSIVATGTV